MACVVESSLDAPDACEEASHCQPVALRFSIHGSFPRHPFLNPRSRCEEDTPPHRGINPPLDSAWRKYGASLPESKGQVLFSFSGPTHQKVAPPADAVPARRGAFFTSLSTHCS